MTPKAQSLPSCTAGPPRVPKQLAEMGSSVTAFFDLATGTLFCLGFFWQGGVFTFFLFFLFFLYWRLPRLFSPFRRADRPPLPRCLPRRESERPAPTRRPPPAAPGRGCSPRGPLPGSGRRQQAPDPNCHRRNKQANKQTRARFQICLPKPNEQSRPSARWHRRGRQGRLAGRGGGGPGTALPSPSPPGWPETTLGMNFPDGDAQPGWGPLALGQSCLKGRGARWGMTLLRRCMKQLDHLFLAALRRGKPLARRVMSTQETGWTGREGFYRHGLLPLHAAAGRARERQDSPPGAEVTRPRRRGCSSHAPCTTSAGREGAGGEGPGHNVG